MKSLISNLVSVLITLVILSLFCVSCSDETTSAPAHENSGTLDPTFSDDGMQAYHNVSIDYGQALSIAPNNSVYLVGYSSNGVDFDVVSLKYDTIGTLDTSFSTDGVDLYDGGNGGDYGFATALDSAGNLYVAGRSNNAADYDAVILKYGSDGVLDTSFGTNGVQMYDGGIGNDVAYGIAIDSDNNLFLAGSTDNGSDLDVLVQKYDATGTLDTTFGTAGVQTYDGGSGNDGGRSIVLDSSDNVYVTGYSNGGVYNDVLVLKYDATGTLDTTFGTAGVRAYDGGSGGEVGHDIVLDSDDNIYVTGEVYNISSMNIFVLKYDATGTLDTTFGTAGVQTYDGGNADLGYGIALDSRDRAVVVGSSHNGINNDMVVLRYTTSGILDPEFDTDGDSDGVVIIDGAAGTPGSSDSARSVAIDSSGRLLVAGTSTGTGNDAVVVRLK